MLKTLLLLAVFVPTISFGQPCELSHYQGLNHRVCDALLLADRLIDEHQPAAASAVLKDLDADKSIAPELGTAIRDSRIRAQEASTAQSVRDAAFFPSLWTASGKKRRACLPG